VAFSVSSVLESSITKTGSVATAAARAPLFDTEDCLLHNATGGLTPVPGG
jgi:hypothetical protein